MGFMIRKRNINESRTEISRGWGSGKDVKRAEKDRQGRSIEAIRHWKEERTVKRWEGEQGTEHS